LAGGAAGDAGRVRGAVRQVRRADRAGGARAAPLAPWCAGREAGSSASRAWFDGLRADAGAGGSRAHARTAGDSHPVQPAVLRAAGVRHPPPHRSAGRPDGLDDVARAGGAGVRASALAALATVAAAAALLLAVGQAAPRAAGTPRGSHAPTHYSAPFAGLFPARDVWGQDERTR